MVLKKYKNNQLPSNFTKSLCKDNTELIINLFVRKESNMEYVLFHRVFTSRINFLYLTYNFSVKANSSSSFLGDLLISITKALTLSIIVCNFFNPAFTTRAIIYASYLMIL